MTEWRVSLSRYLAAPESLKMLDMGNALKVRAAHMRSLASVTLFL